MRSRLAFLTAVICMAVVGAPAPASAEPRRPVCPASTLTQAGTPVHAPSARGSVWALPFNDVPPAVGDTVKIVWRVTGKGRLHVVFRDPSGARHPLDFGPEEHSASSFRHPGREWGTGFTFDSTGCWTIHVERVGTSSTVGVRVSSTPSRADNVTDARLVSPRATAP